MTLRNPVLTLEQAEDIYALLVERAGANAEDDSRNDFVQYVTEEQYLHEYRFQGNLGWGGKFYIEPRGWRVSCYKEDRNDLRDLIVQRTNEALKELHAQST